MMTSYRARKNSQSSPQASLPNIPAFCKKIRTQQVVLLRRKKCIECYREEIAATGSTLKRYMSSMSLPLGEGDRDGEGPACAHCPSRGKTFYDPKGEEGGPQAPATWG